MADISQLLANSAQTNADFDFGKLNKSYWEGVNNRAGQDVREAFKNGVPIDATGQPDFSAMAKVLFQKGDMGQGIAAANLGLTQQNQQFGQGQSRNIQAVEGGAQPLPPSANRTATVSVAPPIARGTDPKPQGQSLMQVVAASGIPNNQLGAATASIARQLGLEDQNAPIDLNDPQVRNVLVPAIQQLKRMGIGEVAQQPAAAPQPIPQAAQVAQAPQGQPSPVTNAVTSPNAPQTPSRAEQMIAFYSGIMSDPRSPKQNVDLAKERLSALQKSNELTPELKNYAQAVNQGFRGTFQDFQTEQESSKAGATERAKADVKEQQEYISQGRMAQQRLGTLNTISNIINSDKNLSLGFGSETTLKIKMALEQAGLDFGDLSGAQLIQKLNGVLASESSKSFSTRPTQFEFKTFLANNPGLALDEKGNVRMLGILAQTAKREADLGKLARQNQDNWQKWDDVVENYDKSHPIKDPTTGKILSNHSIIAPEGKPKSDQPARFASPSDVQAAIKAGKLKSGDAFLTPDGRTKYAP
jgi:hypothetical protein